MSPWKNPGVRIAVCSSRTLPSPTPTNTFTMNYVKFIVAHRAHCLCSIKTRWAGRHDLLKKTNQVPEMVCPRDHQDTLVELICSKKKHAGWDVDLTCLTDTQVDSSTWAAWKTCGSETLALPDQQKKQDDSSAWFVWTTSICGLLPDLL